MCNGIRGMKMERIPSQIIIHFDDKVIEEDKWGLWRDRGMEGTMHDCLAMANRDSAQVWMCARVFTPWEIRACLRWSNKGWLKRRGVKGGWNAKKWIKGEEQGFGSPKYFRFIIEKWEWRKGQPGCLWK